MGPGTSIVTVPFNDSSSGINWGTGIFDGDLHQSLTLIHFLGGVVQGPAQTAPPPELDCHGFADAVQKIADAAISMKDFKNQLAKTFTSARHSGLREMLNNSSGVGTARTTDNGFRPELREARDSHNQARHYVAGFIIGGWGSLGLKFMNDREVPGTPDYASDTALNKISTEHGSTFGGREIEYTRRYLARRIRIDVCGDPRK